MLGRISSDDKKALLLGRSIASVRLTTLRSQIANRYLNHIEDRHISELEFDITPDDLSFLDLERILSVISRVPNTLDLKTGRKEK